MRALIIDRLSTAWFAAQILTYRVGPYLVLNFLDDPAMLALIFC